MFLGYLAIYGFPALGILLAIVLVLRVLKSLQIGIMGRRVAFCALSALLLTPSISGAIVNIFWVPSGLLLLTGNLPMLHQPRLVEFAVVSFSATAAASAIIACIFIRRSEKSSSAPIFWVTGVGLPMFTVVFLLAVFIYATSSRKIPSHIDWTLIESEFGGHLNALQATLKIDDTRMALKEREQLHQIFEHDPVFWRVQLSDKRFDPNGTNPVFERVRSEAFSCSDQRGLHGNLMRCSRDIGELFRKDTLKYTRDTYSQTQGRVRVEIEFDLDTLLKRYEASKVSSFADRTTCEQHEKLIGNWLLNRRFDAGVRESRLESVTLKVEPRIDNGAYPILAEASLHLSDANHSSFKCNFAEDRCKWEGTSTGMLRACGDRIQIRYDDSTWVDDMLEMTSDGMVGVDPWGYTLHFRRADAP